MVRAAHTKEALELQERVDRIARGAAEMTDTKLKKQFIDGCGDILPNVTLEKVLAENFEEVGAPKFDENDMKLAKEITESYELKGSLMPKIAEALSPEHKAYVEKMSEDGTKPLCDYVIPYEHLGLKSAGSSDVGDVSWLTPTAQIRVACEAAGSPGHSWQNVSCGACGIGHKGLLTAGKVICGAAIDLFEDPSIIEAAREEWKKASKEGYYCPVPADAVPVVSGKLIEVE